MAKGNATFSVVLSIEQLEGLDRAKNLSGESSRSAYVRETLEYHISSRKIKPRLSRQENDKGFGSYIKKISVTLSSDNNLKHLDEIVELENTTRSRFVREFIESLIKP